MRTKGDKPLSGPSPYLHTPLEGWPGGKTRDQCCGPPSRPRGLSARPRLPTPGHHLLPPGVIKSRARARAPPPPTQRGSLGRGGVKEIQTPSPFQGLGRLFIQPAPGLSSRWPPGEFLFRESATVCGADAGVVRCSPFPARWYGRVRPGAVCSFRPRRRHQSRREEAKQGPGANWPGNFRPGSLTPEPLWEVPAGARATGGQRRAAAGSGEGAWPDVSRAGGAGRGEAENGVGGALVEWWKSTEFASAVSGGLWRPC